MNEWDYVYACGKWGSHGNLNDGSILLEEIDPTRKN